MSDALTRPATRRAAGGELVLTGNQPSGRRDARILSALAAAVLVSTALAAGGDGGPPDQDAAPTFTEGEALARIDLVTPHADVYIVRATIPLPPRVYPLADGRSPFVVRDPHNRDFPAQVEIVSRYADPDDLADVVEVIAKVERAEDYAPGEWVTHQVVWSPHDRGVTEPDPDVAALLDQPGSIVLRGRDVFGHVYKADLLRDRRLNNTDLRVFRNGDHVHQVRTHETLMPEEPIPGPLGTLPHFLGAHSYVSVWDGQPFLSLDLRVHNGHDGLHASDANDDPLGRMYFRELELVLPEEWRLYTAFKDPMFGESYVEGNRRVWPIVMGMSDHTMHVMPQQGQFHRRLVIARPGAEPLARIYLREETLGFCQSGQSPTGREYFSWWNPQTACYFPQKEALPDLWNIGRPTLQKALAERYRVFEETLRLGLDGPFPVTVGTLGWAHPWGLSIGYAHGGDEIHFYDGVRTAYAASNPGYRYFQLVHRMSTDRHPVALFDRDGDAFTMEDWLVQGPNGTYVPVFMWIYPVLFLGDPFGFGSSPSFQRHAVAGLGLRPGYESMLLGFENIDQAHLIRYTRSPKVLAWLGNDALGKDDLMLQGELARVSYTILPQDPWGGYIYTGLLNDKLQVDAKPRVGIAMHRGEGWNTDAMVAAYCIAGPEWREKTRAWFYDILDLIEDGASDCTGIIQGDPNLDTFHGDYRSRQSISAAIMQNAFWGVMKSVFGDRDPLARDRMGAVLAEDLYGMLSDVVWNETGRAPWFQVAVGPYDLTLPDFCDDYPDDGFAEGWDAHQTWCAFAYGYRLTNDPIFLQYATDMLGQPLSTPALALWEYGTIENRVALITLVQQLLE